MHAHTHTCVLWPSGLCPGLPGWASTRKAKPIWILLKQETVGGSGISWAICKSAPCSRHITMPAPHHSVFTGRMPFLPPNQQHQSTERILSFHWNSAQNNLDLQLNFTMMSFYVPPNHCLILSGKCTYMPSLVLLSTAEPLDHIQALPNLLTITRMGNTIYICLQCFDAVGWVAGRASGL